MSGGHAFDYNQHRIMDIQDSIEELIASNKTPDDFGESRGYSNETLERFEEALYHLEVAYEFAQRIDWLVSGDDGEEEFHNRLETALAKIERNTL